LEVVMGSIASSWLWTCSSCCGFLFARGILLPK